MANLTMLYRTQLTVTAGDAGIVDAGGGLFYKEFSIAPTVVKPQSTLADGQISDSRLPSIPEPSAGMVHRGAFVWLQGASAIRLYWRGELITDVDYGAEAITAAVQLVDFNIIGNKLNEIMHHILRALGHLGENQIVDQIARDNVTRNMIGYRERTFATRENALAATPNIADAAPLQAGELSRIKRTVSVDKAHNDRDLMYRTLELALPTPGQD